MVAVEQVVAGVAVDFDVGDRDVDAQIGAVPLLIEQVGDRARNDSSVLVPGDNNKL